MHPAGLTPSSQPARKALDTSRKLSSTSPETPSSRTTTVVTCPKVEAKEPSKKDESVQTSAQQRQPKQSLDTSTNCDASTSELTAISGDKQTAKIPPFSHLHAPLSTCAGTLTTHTSVCSSSTVSSCVSQAIYTKVLSVATETQVPSSNPQSGQTEVPTTSGNSDNLTVVTQFHPSPGGTFHPVVATNPQCVCQKRIQFQIKYGSKGASTVDPIVIESDDEEEMSVLPTKDPGTTEKGGVFC